MSAGLTFDILRPAHGADCTNHGLSGKVTEITVVDDTLPKLTTPSARAPEFKVVRRNLFGGVYLHLEPVDRPVGAVGPMFGGNFAYTSDSRGRKVAEYPLPIHDRFETKEEYERFSM